jgi:hypothetical protein
MALVCHNIFKKSITIQCIMDGKETFGATVPLSKENCREKTKTKGFSQKKIPNYQYKLSVCVSTDEIDGRVYA